ncbi:cytochrome P450 18a1-like [Amphiura filiformis]|uniref:cytochrome P450 18a1-like n=1 Tax=Amphiura filiformis TaxID=82378 RepID=UPI003B21FF2B
MGSVFAELITGSSLQSACICIAIFLFLAWLAKRSRQYPHPLPPGPWGLPIFGYLPQMAIAAKRHGQEPHDVFDVLAKQYGRIFSLKLGNRLVVVLNDFETIKHAFQHHDLNDRPVNTLTVGMKNIGKGVGYSNGEQWKELRRFTFTIFRKVGVGKTTFEQKIIEEAQSFITEISQVKGAPFDFHEQVEYATTNVISSILLGKRFDYADKELKRQLDLQHRNTNLIGRGGILLFMPVMQIFAAKARDEYVANLLEILNFHEEIVKEHIKTFDANDLRNFIDEYLLQMQKNKEDGIESNLTYKNLVMTLGNIFFAATGTACEVLTWMCTFVTAYPDIQKRIHDEIDGAVGPGRLPRLSDRSQMPYTQAVMWESMRLGTIQPIGLPHVAACDTSLLGHTIPKGSILMPNIWAVHHDSKLWTDPETFNPDRFLSPEGKLISRPEQLIPFGIGRRMCLGEQLARSELFIIFSHLLHRFTFTTPENDPPIQTKGVFSLNYIAAPFRVCANERH